MSEYQQEAAAVVALLSLAEMGPVRLRALLETYGASDAWDRVRRGRLELERLDVRGDAVRLGQRWRSAASHVDVDELWRAHRTAGIDIVRLGDVRYPQALTEDPEPPEVLFVAGDLDAITTPAVAVIGTRRCTSYGARTARLFGGGLAAAGVSVVSGLALGIDAAAHLGALAVESGTPPVAVVGTGLDVVYPTRNRELWRDVARSGAVISESPMGTRPNAWRFPARNRIIAALSQVVVVVESRDSGGSLHTAREAIVRDRDILAVPGPIHAPESSGTNSLLFDGWGPARSVDDILSLLGLCAAPGPDPMEEQGTLTDGPSSPLGRQVLDGLGAELLRLDELVTVTGLDLAVLATEVQRLVADGWITPVGARFERCR